jgi:hypothetical protein
VASIVTNSAHSYWLTASYMVAPFPSGFSVVFTITVSPPAGSAVVTCIASLASAMLAKMSIEEQADAWASALHQLTLSVKTTHIGLDTTVPTPLPKTESDKDIT